MSITCENCHTGIMIEPEDKHPSYLVCNNCEAIQLTYCPTEYQTKMHTTPYKVKNGHIAPQIIGVFGG